MPLITGYATLTPYAEAKIRRCHSYFRCQLIRLPAKIRQRLQLLTDTLLHIDTAASADDAAGRHDDEDDS